VGTLVVGAGAGMAFLAGITLLGREVDDAVRGRIFAFINTGARVVLMASVAGAGVVAGFGSARRVDLGFVSIELSFSRLLLLAAAVLSVIAGIAAFRQMDDKPGVPVFADLWSSMRGRPIMPGKTADGYFVVFEGGEGSGKSTQSVKLAAWLRVRGHEVVLTREPGATELGNRIRSLVLDPASNTSPSVRAEALLYAADRAQHVDKVLRPALDRGDVVISDRYIDSSLAYQGSGRELPADEIAWLSNWATDGLKPDLVVLLDIDPTHGLARATDGGKGDRLEQESLEFHEKVRFKFRDLAATDPARYLVVDATRDRDEIAKIIAEHVSLQLAAPEGSQSDANWPRFGEPDGVSGEKPTSPDNAAENDTDTETSDTTATVEADATVRLTSPGKETDDSNPSDPDTTTKLPSEVDATKPLKSPSVQYKTGRATP